jgi:hypothetical protein
MAAFPRRVYSTGMWRIVIQNSDSFGFLTEAGTWDYEVKAARKFDRVLTAAEHCVKLDLKRVHIVMGRVQPDGRFDSSSKTIIRVPRVITTSAEALTANRPLAG